MLLSLLTGGLSLLYFNACQMIMLPSYLTPGLSIPRVMQDPEVCKVMYPFLPEHMRNPQGVRLMMSDPHIRDQVEGALKQAFKVWQSGILKPCHQCTSTHCSDKASM